MKHTGTLLTGDFSEKTMTFEIEGEMVLQAGKYHILSDDEYQKLVTYEVSSGVSECRKCNGSGRYDGYTEDIVCGKCGGTGFR